ncbi:M48 family metallopeptidase [Pseudemcibacter aquimaris]|uniref:M48 family metallopeptidase n=1 Tax=Pseudemcibacter aquimaris TaxID=2857064 RepID=UPI002011D7CE|nr:M48 family metallopeptidase [Pseudemcibacter aquimaris]MCC3862404.1 M48 family metallopeptidase [Pseudemcibacter aquimaris]WDU59166.1 M48 family metallopeptidase [Pseudemcibacter aquimaris]
MKLKALFYDGNTALAQSIEVVLLPNGFELPTGEVWEYGLLKLISQKKDQNQLTYRHKNQKDPSLTILFEGEKDLNKRDYLNRVSKHLTGDNNWHFVRWQIVSAAAICCLAFVFYLGYPYLNRAIVATVPDTWAEKAGDLVVDALYQQYTSDTCHNPAGDVALGKVINSLEVDDLPYPLRVEVVDNPLVNAMTAPGGRIIIFNGLLQQAESPEEVAGVLSHEIGHVYYQHPMQGLVNVMGFSIIGSFLGGDAASIAIIGLSLTYSRDLERDADEMALDILRNNEITASGILDFFKRNEEKKEDNIVAEIADIFSTHPLTEERIDLFNNHIETYEKSLISKTLLSETEWQSLVNICSAVEE